VNYKTNTKSLPFSEEKISLSPEYANLCSEKNSISCKCSFKSEIAEWLTSKQAAEYLNLPIGTLRNLTSNGKIPYYKLGHLNRYLREDLRKLLLKEKRGANHGN
jgi:excisionase family DNA binding protein